MFDVFSFDLTGSPLQKPRRYFSESSTITSNERLVCKPYNGVVRPWATRSQKFSVVEKLSHGCRRLEKSMISYSIVTDGLGAMYALDAMYVSQSTGQRFNLNSTSVGPRISEMASIGKEENLGAIGELVDNERDFHLVK